jgi:hypothetical protein
MECSKFGKSFIILIILAFTAAIGVILLFIGCAMGFERAIAGEHTVNWWGLLVCEYRLIYDPPSLILYLVGVFYLMSPVPLAIARCCSIKECMPEEYLRILYDLCYFISACIVISGFGFPLVLARKSLVMI